MSDPLLGSIPCIRLTSAEERHLEDEGVQGCFPVLDRLISSQVHKHQHLALCILWDVVYDLEIRALSLAIQVYDYTAQGLAITLTATAVMAAYGVCKLVLLLKTRSWEGPKPIVNLPLQCSSGLSTAEAAYQQQLCTSDRTWAPDTRAPRS